MHRKVINILLSFVFKYLKFYQVSNFEDLYNWQKLKRQGPEYILHDGPPYANGDVHLGHAVNKVYETGFWLYLNDFIYILF